MLPILVGQKLPAGSHDPAGGVEVCMNEGDEDVVITEVPDDDVLSESSNKLDLIVMRHDEELQGSDR